MKMLLSIIHFVTFAACNATQNRSPMQPETVVQGIPSCIQEKIESFKKEPKQNPPRAITEYTYKGKKVYYITAACCDQFSELYDADCNLLGHPDGGFTGKGDGKLPGFGSEATGEKLVWKDDR